MPDGPDVQNLFQALTVEGTGLRTVSIMVGKGRRLPVASRPASTAVPQGGSSAHQFRSGAKFVDRALLFPVRMRVPSGRRTLLVFEREFGLASEVVEVSSPGRI